MHISSGATYAYYYLGSFRARSLHEQLIKRLAQLLVADSFSLFAKL